MQNLDQDQSGVDVSGRNWHEMMTVMETMDSPGPRPVTADSDAPTQRFADKRLAREWQTIAAMIGCYCRGHHATHGALCPDCQGLSDYAAVRLERCRFGPGKPVCAKCPVHCYQPTRREQIRVVMRYSGPRMLWHHPVLSLRHWLDGFRQAPEL